MKRTVGTGEKNEGWKGKIRTGAERTERRVDRRRHEEEKRNTEERLRSDVKVISHLGHLFQPRKHRLLQGTRQRKMA